MMLVVILFLVAITLHYYPYILQSLKLETPPSVATSNADNETSTSTITSTSTLHSIQRLDVLRDTWLKLSVEKNILVLIRNLMTMNNTSPQGIGSPEILMAYRQLKGYQQEHYSTVRLTCVYSDGIVFFDSALPIDKVYFMNNGLPMPVSLFTLGSPLKNHNTLPEIMNSLILHYPKPPKDQTSENVPYLMGQPLESSFFRQLNLEGFGFCERISSSLGVPYTYLSRVVFWSREDLDNPIRVIHGCTLRVSVPVTSS